VQHFIASYGYAAVFLLMLAESACIPIPSELIMLFGGALAAGAVPGAHPALAGIIIAGAAGNVAGSYLAWAAGRYWGQAALRRVAPRVGLREHDIDRAVGWFEKYGPAAVFFGRLMPVVRTFISLPAGFAGMPAVRFGVYTAAGCLPWTAGLAAAGYAVGRNWQAVANGFHGPTYIIAAVIAIALAVGFFRLRAHRANADRQADTDRRADTGRQADTAPAGPPDGRPWPAPGPGRDWPGADRQRRALWQAIGSAEFAVLEAQQAGVRTGELNELCHHLRLAARDAGFFPPPVQSSSAPGRSTPPPVQPASAPGRSQAPGRPSEQSASVIGDLTTAARMIQDAAASTAAQAQAQEQAGTAARIPADAIRLQTEAIAARIASAAQAIAHSSAADSQG
jgi:membrane protein DedA with SNARE-associated domain